MLAGVSGAILRPGLCQGTPWPFTASRRDVTLRPVGGFRVFQAPLQWPTAWVQPQLAEGFAAHPQSSAGFTPAACTGSKQGKPVCASSRGSISAIR
jgi:hypothetical protein